MPATERDLAWEWARAEFNSARFGALYTPHVTPSMMGALMSGDRSRLTDWEWSLLEQLVSGVRRPLLAGLPRLGATWYTGHIATGDLADLRLVWPPFRALSPSARLGELASVDTSKPAICGRVKTGHFRRPRPVMVYRVASSWRKSA